MVVGAWMFAVAAVAAAMLTTATASPFVRMLAIVAAVFFGAKGVVLATARRRGVVVPPANLPWFLLWFGMSPRQFVKRRMVATASRTRRWQRSGLACVLVGIALAVGARALGGTLGGCVLVVALSVVLHFGLFALFAAAMRGKGFPVPLLFNAPWRARTLAEFWSRRWNHGFAEMTALLVQRPLAPRFGVATALLVSFGWSGLLHELALSWPVRAGYGLPTLYFLLQGLVVLWQRHRPSRVVTFAALVLPLPLVFHPWFLQGVLVPLLG